MIAKKHEPSTAMLVVADFLRQQGFNEAATHLLEASEEVQGDIDDAKYANWLSYQHDLKKARQSSGDEDDLPWE